MSRVLMIFSHTNKIAKDNRGKSTRAGYRACQLVGCVAFEERNLRIQGGGEGSMNPGLAVPHSWARNQIQTEKASS